jgi:peroxiredoxin
LKTHPKNNNDKQMKYYKIYLFLILNIFIFPDNTIQSQTFRVIDISFRSLKNSHVYLGFHQGNKQLISDTLYIDADGKLRIQSHFNSHPGGLYFLVLPGEKTLELLLSDEKEIKLKTDTGDLIRNTKVLQSQENKYYYSWLVYLVDYDEKMNALYKELKEYEKKSDHPSQIQTEKKMEEMSVELNLFYTDLIEKSQGSFFHSLMIARLEPEPGKKKPEESENTYFEYLYNFYQAHYFDHIDFADQRLLRTPFLEKKIDNYIEKYTRKHPDSIKYAAERIIEKSKADTLVFRFVLTKLFHLSYYSKYSAMETVFVYLADKYYLTGQAYWEDAAQLARIENRVKNLRNNLTGMQAKELVLKNPEGTYSSLYKSKARHNILIFWDPECAICEKNILKLRDITQKYDTDFLSVFAVYDGKDQEIWKKFIFENDLKQWIHVYDPDNESDYGINYDVQGTPLIYYLDSNMIIKAKKIGPADVDKILSGKIQL